MDEQIKMHAEYRVETSVKDGEWKPYNNSIQHSAIAAKLVLNSANQFYPERKGYKHRITMRLVGDWCEMKENGKCSKTSM